MAPIIFLILLRKIVRQKRIIIFNNNFRSKILIDKKLISKNTFKIPNDKEGFTLLKNQPRYNKNVEILISKDNNFSLMHF